MTTDILSLFLDVVDKGTNLTLKCKVEPQPHPIYTWEKNYNYQKTSFKTQTLIFSKITYHDAGTYRCKYYWLGSTWHYGIKTVIVVQGM